MLGFVPLPVLYDHVQFPFAARLQKGLIQLKGRETRDILSGVRLDSPSRVPDWSWLRAVDEMVKGGGACNALAELLSSAALGNRLAERTEPKLPLCRPLRWLLGVWVPTASRRSEPQTHTCSWYFRH